MKRWWLLLVLALGLSLLIVWRLQQNKAVAAVQDQQRAARMKALPVVSVSEVTLQRLSNAVEGVGTVDALMDVQVASKTPGRLIAVNALPGDSVRAGQVLVQVDSAQLQAQVQQQQAALDEARFRLSQAESTEQPTIVGVNTQIQEQQAALTSARANYAQVKANAAQQYAQAESAVTDSRAKVESAKAGIDSAQAQVGSAQANLANAQSQYRRLHDLFVKGFVSAQDVDTASTAVQVAQGALDVAKSQFRGAQSAERSASAELQSAEHQADIIRNKSGSDIAAALAGVQQSEAALTNARANMAQKPAYRQNLAALRATVAAAQASLADVQSMLGDTIVRAPFDGYVITRVLDPGAVVSAGTPVLTLRYLRRVRVTVPIPEEAIARVTVGRVASVTFDALPGLRFVGHVTEVPPSADPTTRQFPVRIGLDNPNGLLKTGLFARVSIDTGSTPPVVTVPPEAIQKTPPGPAVLVVDHDGTVHRVAVIPGRGDAAHVVVTGNVHPGDQVVTLTAAPVKAGQKVQISKSAPTTAA